MLPQLGLATVLASQLAAQAQFVVRTPPVVATTFLAEGVAADFDRDGDVDLCGSVGLFAPAPLMRLLRNDGGERFVDATAGSLPASPPLGSAVTRTVALDIEPDGDVDLFVITGGATLLWRNQGNGTFVDASASLPPNTGGFPDAIAVDVDGDGDTDVVAAGSSLFSSSNLLFVNQGGGAFAAASPFPGNSSTVVAAADLDLDGDADLCLGTWNGLRVLRNDGTLVFTDVTTQWLSALANGVVRDVVLGDLDGNGFPDAIVCHQNSGLDSVLHSTGGAFTAASTLPTTYAGNQSMVLVDADDDGDLDLLRGQTSGAVSLAVNDGSGALTVSASRLPPLTSLSPNLIVADFDDDGDADVLVAEMFTAASVLMNRHRDLRPGQPVVGQPWNVEVWSEPGYATLHHTARLGIALAPLAPPLAVPGLGNLRLDLGSGYAFFEGVVLASSGVHTFALAVPPLPALVGLPLHLQALAEQARSPARFTAWHATTVQ